jgi:hypothetical protein
VGALGEVGGPLCSVWVPYGYSGQTLHLEAAEGGFRTCSVINSYVTVRESLGLRPPFQNGTHYTLVMRWKRVHTASVRDMRELEKRWVRDQS